MKFNIKLVILAAAPLLMAALWMDDQPSFKPYQAPVLTPPATAVPVTGKELVSRRDVLNNPVPPNPESQARGKALFEINCALCHGQTSAQRGPVGLKLAPPAPALGQDMLQGLNDDTIFKAITLGFGRMPPFQGKLTPQERWNLVNYLRTRH
jgi:mono/diheme cytochrome c family protein